MSTSSDTEVTAAPRTDTQAQTPPAVRGTRLTLGRAALGRPDAPVLADVDLDVAPGEILTVVGPSGCGKSTLLRTLAGLLTPLAGEITQDGSPLTGPSAERALIFQEDALLPWRTLRANVELPLAIRGLSRTERRAQAESWLGRVGLADHARHLPHRVSGGQRQRAQLARALAGRPAPSSWTNPSARSTPRPAPACRTCWWRCSRARARPSSSSPTTSTRPCFSATVWRSSATAG